MPSLKKMEKHENCAWSSRTEGISDRLCTARIFNKKCLTAAPTTGINENEKHYRDIKRGTSEQSGSERELHF